MPAGRYRTQITIERSEKTTDPDTKERVDSWSPWIVRRASVRAVGAREIQLPDTINSVLISHTVRLRVDSLSRRITQGMRIRINGRGANRYILHIESVIEVEESGIELELRCVERTYQI